MLSGRERWEDIEDRPDRVLIEDGIVLLGQGVLPDRSLNTSRQLGRGNHPAAHALCARTCGDRDGSPTDQISDTRCGRARAARRLSIRS